MSQLLKSTDVRKNWSQFIDDVRWVKPAFIKRKRDVIAVLSGEVLEFILKEYVLTVSVYKEEDNSLTGSFNEIDLSVNAKDEESLKEAAVKELLEYSEEYINEFSLYFNSPNRKKHFPFIYRAMLAGNSTDKVKEMFVFNFKIKNTAR